MEIPTLPKPKKLTKKQIWGIIIALAILVYLIFSYTPLNPYLLIIYPQSKWQAVFLSNNQVYFGKIAKMNRKNITLKEIYYLQTVTQPLQRSLGAEGTQEVEQKLTLVKLGSEIHGPEDTMTINRDYVLLVENLKADSNVVQAIERYLAEQ